jgi:hypothetical protein
MVSGWSDAPVGLPIGSGDAATIALSIVAEIQSEFHGKQVTVLDKRQRAGNKLPEKIHFSVCPRCRVKQGISLNRPATIRTSLTILNGSANLAATNDGQKTL